MLKPHQIKSMGLFVKSAFFDSKNNNNELRNSQDLSFGHKRYLVPLNNFLYCDISKFKLHVDNQVRRQIIRQSGKTCSKHHAHNVTITHYNHCLHIII